MTRPKVAVDIEVEARWIPFEFNPDLPDEGTT